MIHRFQAQYPDTVICICLFTKDGELLWASTDFDGIPVKEAMSLVPSFSQSLESVSAASL